MKARKTFHISRKPVISLADDGESHAFSNDLELPRFQGPPRLVAIARDPWTIFAYWNVNWPPIFKNVAPVDRQFHLRFQQLVDLFGAANDDALATVISRFQARAVSGGKHERLSSEERKILQRTGIAQSQLADARRAFNQIDREKLKRRAEALLGA